MPSAAAAENSRGHQDDGAQQLEYALHREADNPQRQHQQPHQRIQYDCQQRQWPADHQQQQP